MQAYFWFEYTVNIRQMWHIVVEYGNANKCQLTLLGFVLGHHTQNLFAILPGPISKHVRYTTTFTVSEQRRIP